MISQETLNTLLLYINDIDTTIIEKTVKKDPTKTELILWCVACLQEETGELASEVRKLTWMSFNQKKVDAFHPEDLHEEIIDVLIVLLLFARRLWIENLDEAIMKKIQKNNTRWY